jgi:hypothetical protein
LGNSQFLSIIAVFLANLISNNMKKIINERKPIQQDLDRVSRYRKKYGAADDKAELDAAFAELKSKAKNVSGDNLSDWDRESLRLATEYVRDENRDEFRRTINRILELAGLSPEMEKEIFQRQQILQKEIEKKND